MNRFLLLALTAGLLSPIASKAEITYLECNGRALGKDKMNAALTNFNVTVNESMSEASIDGRFRQYPGWYWGKNPSRARLVSSQSEFLIYSPIAASSNFQIFLRINRYNGSYLFRTQSTRFQNIGDDRSSGTCSKASAQNRAF